MKDYSETFIAGQGRDRKHSHGSSVLALPSFLDCTANYWSTSTWLVPVEGAVVLLDDGSVMSDICCSFKCDSESSKSECLLGRLCSSSDGQAIVGAVPLSELSPLDSDFLPSCVAIKPMIAMTCWTICAAAWLRPPRTPLRSAATAIIEMAHSGSCLTVSTEQMHTLLVLFTLFSIYYFLVWRTFH